MNPISTKKKRPESPLQAGHNENALPDDDDGVHHTVRQLVSKPPHIPSMRVEMLNSLLSVSLPKEVALVCSSNGTFSPKETFLALLTLPASSPEEEAALDSALRHFSYNSVAELVDGLRAGARSCDKGNRSQDKERILLAITRNYKNLLSKCFSNDALSEDTVRSLMAICSSMLSRFAEMLYSVIDDETASMYSPNYLCPKLLTLSYDEDNISSGNQKQKKHSFNSALSVIVAKGGVTHVVKAIFTLAINEQKALTLCQTVCRQVNQMGDSSRIIASICRSVMSDYRMKRYRRGSVHISRSVVETIVSTLLKTSKNALAVVEKLLLQPPHPAGSRRLASIFICAVKDCEDWTRRTKPIAVLNSCVSLWSTSSYLQTSEENWQIFVGRVLLGLLPTVQEVDRSGGVWQDVLQSLIGGVSKRLGCDVVKLRRSGMRVGEALGEIIGEGGVKFEELREGEGLSGSEDDSNSDGNDSQDDGTGEGEDADGKGGRAADNEKRKQAKNPKSSSPYSLEDDESDLKTVQRPTYLSSTIPLLRAAESDPNALSKLETALRSLPSIVASSPPDIVDLGVVLCNEMVHLENKFNTEDFAERREEVILELLKGRGSGDIFEYLIKTVFTGVSSGNRYELLRLMIKGSELKSGLDLSEKKNSSSGEGGGALKKIAPEDRSRGKGSIVKKRTDANNKTVRWGKLALYSNGSGGQGKVIKNDFGPMGKKLFYLLLSHFVKSRSEASIWQSSDAAGLVGAVLNVLCSFLLHSRNFGGADMMARDLFSVSFQFCHDFSDDSGSNALREAVLYATMVAFDNMTGYDVYHMSRVHGVEEWCKVVLKTDKNEQVREMAKAVRKFCRNANSMVPLC